MRQGTNEISISASAVARILGLMTFFLVVAGTLGQVSRFLFGYDSVFVGLFNLDDEANIPTFYSMLLLLVAAALLAVITILNRKRRAPHVSKWAVLSLGFLLMAYDEAFRIHERLASRVTTFFGDIDLGIFYFAWVIPYTFLVLILGLFFVRFLLHLPSITRFRFLIAAALFVGGAIGVEFIEGSYAQLHGEANLTYSMIAAVQEGLEMTGVVVFIWALLNYFASDLQKELRVILRARD